MLKNFFTSFLLVTGLAVLLLWPFSLFAQDVTLNAPPPDLTVILQQVLGVIGDFKTGAVLTGFIALVNLLTNLTKVPWLTERVPAKARPWIALGLGALGATFTAKQSGASWFNAAFAGLIAGLGSIGLHELINTFKARPADEVGKVVAAAVKGDAAATAKVQGLSDELDGIQKLSPHLRSTALAEWAKSHPPVGT